MLEELKARLREHEGVVPHLYLDTSPGDLWGRPIIPMPTRWPDTNGAANGTEAPVVDKVRMVP